MVASDSVTRIPLNTLAIPFGLAGLAEVWSHSADALGLPAFIGEVFWVVAAASWLWMIAAHVVRGARSSATLGSQLTHPVQGPLAALVPIVGMLLGTNLFGYWPVGGAVLAIASLVTAAVFAGWLVASWTTGRLELESLHGGYFLPTVAAGYIAAYTAATLGSTSVAIAAFAVASLFWVVILTVLIARLAFRPALPAPLLPTLTIIMAPPAVASAAWFAIDGGRLDIVQDVLAGLMVFMLLVELGLLPRYLRLHFSLGFWSFTFPSAAAASLAVAWLAVLQPVGWQVIVIALLIGVTALVTAIAVRSVLLWAAGRAPAFVAAEAQLTRADDLLAPRAP